MGCSSGGPLACGSNGGCGLNDLCVCKEGWGGSSCSVCMLKFRILGDFFKNLYSSSWL